MYDIQAIREKLIEIHDIVKQNRDMSSVLLGAVIETLLIIILIDPQTRDRMFEKMIASQKELMLAIMIRHHDEIFGNKEG